VDRAEIVGRSDDERDERVFWLVVSEELIAWVKALNSKEFKEGATNGGFVLD